MEPEEERRLTRLVPDATLRHRGRDAFLASRPDGGACSLLASHRCRAHDARPHPCREFPLTVHVGRRLQATVVLSCPGVELGPLAAGGAGEGAPAPVGFEAELSALGERLGPAVDRRAALAARRGRKVEARLREEGRWEDDAFVRTELGHVLPLPGPADFPVEDPPERGDGLERLPLYFDHRPGPVAIARAFGGWELLELAPAGGGQTLGLAVPPDRPPGVAPEGRRLLEGYLRYALARDSFLASVQLEMLERAEGTVREWVGEALRALGAQLLSRAAVRAKLDRGEAELLSERDVAKGIRAVDQDWLDRRTWGDRL